MATPEQIRAARVQTQIVNPSDVLRYRDPSNNLRERCIRIKDHGSSALRGEFYIITTIIDEHMDLEDKNDREVSLEKMEEIVRHCIVD